MSDKHYIGGAWHSAASADTFAVVNPATEEIICQVSAGNAQDIDAAVKAARQAFDEGPWPRLSGTQRAVYLRKFADIINRRLDELSKLEVLDNGKPYPEAKWDIEDTAGTFAFYAGLAEQMDSAADQAVTLPEPGFTCKVLKEPIGVAGAIIPWNFPMLMAAWKVAPALAAGCTMVLKPSEITPLTALALSDIADEAGLPAGV